MDVGKLVFGQIGIARDLLHLRRDLPVLLIAVAPLKTLGALLKPALLLGELLMRIAALRLSVLLRLLIGLGGILL